MSLKPQILEVEGFLSFLEPAKLDFRAADIWAITGKNGVGKSSLLNGITFALFGIVYGKKKGFEEVIHDRADKARVCFTFALDGRRFRVTRTVQRRPSGIGSEGLVEYFDGLKWHPVPHTRKIGEMEDWIKRRLRLRPESFTVSVALMQNEQLKLFEATQGEMCRTLVDLASLDFWPFLERHVREGVNEVSGRTKALTGILEDLPLVTPEMEETARRAVTEAEIAVEVANQAREAAVRGLALAEKRDSLTVERDRLSNETEHAALLSAREGELRTGVVEAQGAKDQVVFVAGVVRGRQSLVATRADEERLEAEIRELRARFESARQEVQKLQREEEEAAALYRVKLADAEGLEGAARAAEDVLRKAQERARLQADCDRIAGEMAEIDRALSDWDTVDAAVRHRDAMTQLSGSMTALERALEERDLARLEVSREKDQLSALRTRAEEARRAHEAAQTELSRRQAAEAEAENKLAQGREAYQRKAAVVEARQAALGTDACPTCGRGIDAHSAGEMEAEIAALHQSLATAREEGLALAAAVETARTDRRNQEKLVAEAHGVAEAHRREVENRERRVAELEERAQARHQGAAGAWRQALAGAAAIGIEIAEPARADARERLGSMIAERQQQLAALLPRWQEMSGKRTLRSRLVTEADRLKTALEQTAEVQVSLEQAGEAAKRATEALAVARQSRDVASERAIEARAANERARRELATLESDGRALRTRMEMLGARRVELEENLEATWREAVDAGWPAEREPTQEDVDSLKEVASLLTDLKRQLDAAEEASRKLDGLRERLKAIVEELAGMGDVITLEAARAEDVRTAEAIRSTQDALREHRIRLDTYAAAMERRRQITEELDGLSESAACDKTIVEAIGRKQLQARLMHGALAGIIDAANDVLLRISEGGLSLEMHIGEEDDDFEVRVRDALSPDRPKSFSFISGGMKFRVAVAMAIGIGQYLAERSNTHRVEMLVIDEGFGSLDEEAVDVMREELERISMDVGTVLVVSHNPKVNDSIENAYHVTRDAQTARVERRLGTPALAA